MTRRGSVVQAVTLSFLLGTAAVAQLHDPRALESDPRQADSPIAPVLEGLGPGHMEVTTSDPRSQQFFDQGLRLTYGFNHSEALRAFKEAARLDPDNAMAYWGWALVLGPNLNLPMQPDVVQSAYEAIQMAVALRDQVSARERAYIDALETRYSDDPEDERSLLDAAYADAMREVHEADPTDDHAATLYAAALMNLSPWDYWQQDGRPKGDTEEILATLELVIERDPQHSGALHYYIHAVEAPHPERAEPAADQLRGLAPGAGHLVHMPSHIYMRVGRYEESYEVNTKAVVADEGYITQCRAQGIYPLGYYPHNIHFMAWSAMLEGRSQESLAAARKVSEKIPEHLDESVWALYEFFRSQPYYTMVRFGMWDEILVEPKPLEKAKFMTGIWHYARSLAYLHTGDKRKAKKEFKALTALQKASKEMVFFGFTSAETLLTIAAEIVAGEIESVNGRYDRALPHLERAVRLEDSLPYNEPPDWYFPVRHYLGAALLEAGYPVEAEVAYWADLRKNPENGFSLFGLEKSLRTQGRDAEADAMAERFDAAWARADTQLTTSRY